MKLWFDAVNLEEFEAPSDDQGIDADLWSSTQQQPWPEQLNTRWSLDRDLRPRPTSITKKYNKDIADT